MTRPRRSLLSLLVLMSLPSLISCYCNDGSTSAVRIPFRTRKGPWRKDFFTVQKAAPPLVSLAATTGSNSTTTIPYSASTTTSPELPVVYTNTPSVVSDWLSDHMPVNGCVLGFDVESVPNTPWIKNRASFEGPATVQLATPESGLVMHLADVNGRRSKACGNVLEAVLRDPTIIKAGVGIDDDMLELYSQFKRMDARSRLDVGGIGGHGHSRVSLKRLTKSILGVDLITTRKLSMSDWSRVPLTNAQLAYSARDAWAGAAIMEELAHVDPDTFGTEALMELLQSQRPLRKLHSRAKRCKRAKEQLKNLASHYRTDKDGFQALSLRREHAHRLKNTLGQTAPDRLLLFDVERLGFTIPSK